MDIIRKKLKLVCALVTVMASIFMMPSVALTEVTEDTGKLKKYSAKNPIEIRSRDGRLLKYESLSARQQLTVDATVANLKLQIKGPPPPGEELSCSFGPGNMLGCSAFGYACIVYVDEDGAGGQCWKCEVADCD